jgi:hypothetical protein
MSLTATSPGPAAGRTPKPRGFCVPVVRPVPPRPAPGHGRTW